MTLGLFLGICLGGGVGAALRFVVDGAVRSRWPVTFPWGTFLINVSGSLLLGLLTELALAEVVGEAARLMLGTGVLGGYTTFSTASMETVRLAERGEYLRAFGYGVGTLIASVAAAIVGILLARQFAG